MLLCGFISLKVSWFIHDEYFKQMYGIGVYYVPLPMVVYAFIKY